MPTIDSISVALESAGAHIGSGFAQGMNDLSTAILIWAVLGMAGKVIAAAIERGK